eukprot:1692496-Pleurochrysis_carterae.AAC.1
MKFGISCGDWLHHRAFVNTHVQQQGLTHSSPPPGALRVRCRGAQTRGCGCSGGRRDECFCTPYRWLCTPEPSQDSDQAAPLEDKRPPLACGSRAV